VNGQNPTRSDFAARFSPGRELIPSDGQLAFAKFPHQSDIIDIERWEALALTLAGRAGIPVPEWRIETVAGKTVLLLRRFDRIDACRVPFLSACGNHH
jgi:serine/threonine-protein kinase HipA